jgi:diguanylate cyclase (GGDEF)-like protein
MAIDTRKIWSSSQLPALPQIAAQVLELSRHPATANAELARLLQSDANLALQIVSAANSPLCALSLPISTVEQALSTLGTNCVTSLALSVSLIGTFRSSLMQDSTASAATPNQANATDDGARGPQSQLLRGFWRQAIVKAIAAETLCHIVRDGLEYEYFLAGLTLDLGRFTLLRTVPQEYFSVLKRSRETRVPRTDCETAELGLTAAEVGGQLLEKWGFPARLVRGVQSQHASLQSFEDVASNADGSLRLALALASAIGDYLCDDQQAVSLFRIHELTSQVIPIRREELDPLMQSIVRRFEVVAPVFTTSKSLAASQQIANVDQLKALAIEQLTTMGGRSTDMEARVGDSASHLPAEIERRGSKKEATPLAAPSVQDSLAPVFNETYFAATLLKEVRRCCQVASPLGIAIVQIDRFATKCESLGPQFGEMVLTRIGGILNDLLRSTDTIARFNQQFVILASTPTATGMQKMADRIRARVEGERLIWEGRPTPVTVSVGATLALPGRLDLDVGPKVVATAQEAVHEAAFGDGNNIYFCSLISELELNRLFMANQMRFSRWLVSQGVLDIPRVAKALLSFNQRALRLGELAVRQELLNNNQVQQVLTEQIESNERFGEIAVQRTYLSEDQLTGLLILQQEDPILVASLFMKLSLLEPQRLKDLLQVYFELVPWAAPLNPATGR